MIMNFKRNPIVSIALGLLAMSILVAAVLISYYAIDAKKQAENSNITLTFLLPIMYSK